MIEDLFEQLTGLLGKSEQHESFQNVILELGRPEVDVSPDKMRVCLFARLGFSIIFIDKHQLRKCSELHFFATSWDEGGNVVIPYRGPLPAGIVTGDGRDNVERKFGFSPRLPRARITDGPVKDYLNIYDMEPLELVFTFDRLSHQMIELKVTDLNPPDKVYIL